MRLTAAERFKTDPTFRTIVDVLYHLLEEQDERGIQYTPTEMREAAMLAAMMYEETHIKPFIAENFLFGARPRV